MKTPRKLLVLGLVLVLAGVWAWKFFGIENVKPAIAAPAVTLASISVKPMDLKSAQAVEAPKVAPATPGDTPPAEFTDKDKAWVEGYIHADEEVAANVGTIGQRFMDSAPDDAARARQEQFQKNYAAQLLKQADLLRHAKPPTDLGEIPIAELPEAPGMSVPPNAPKFTLPGGESFTVTLFYTNWWSLLITEDLPGQTGRFAGQYFHQLAIGQPTMLMMQDGALAKFTLEGTMPDAPMDAGPNAGFAGARMGRNAAAGGN
jgi:hypothetical protein